jgi:hypothetical protein
MEINLINSGNKGTDFDTNTEKNEGIIPLAAMEKTQETAEIKAVQAPQKLPSNAKFGGLKIGIGKPSSAMRSALGSGTHISNNSLAGRV